MSGSQEGCSPLWFVITGERLIGRAFSYINPILLSLHRGLQHGLQLQAGEFITECLHLKRGVKQNHNTTINSHEDKRSEDSSDSHAASVAVTPKTLIRSRTCWEEARYTLKSRVPGASWLFLKGYSTTGLHFDSSFCFPRLEEDPAWVEIGPNRDFVRSPYK